MAHKEWCGNACSECQSPCALDESMPCSPDCPHLGLDGETDADECKDCDAIKFDDDRVIASIIWTVADVRQALEDENIEPTDENVAKVLEEFNENDFTEHHIPDMWESFYWIIRDLQRERKLPESEDE